MKVLMVHNCYGSSAPSGENQVFEAEAALLKKKGHTVEKFLRHSDTIRGMGIVGTLKGALCTPWNPFAANALKRNIELGMPDVVHVHNTFPLISPSIFRAIGGRAARVLTLHNYRLFCPAAIPMRMGKVCTECLDNYSSIPSLKYGCYRDSRLATLPLAINVGLQRFLGTWIKHVDAFIVLSEFQREKMIKAGLPAELVHVKSNFFPGQPNVLPWSSREPYIVFAGRLSLEKGLRSLIHAWKIWGKEAPELRLVGDGDLREELELEVKDLPIKFLGQLSSLEAQRQVAGARLLILPSEWFEGFPMVIREAFAFGTPAAVSDIGPLSSIVQHQVSGLVFRPADPKSLVREVRTAWDDPGQLERLGKGARVEFERNYTEDVNYSSLKTVYEKAIDISKRRTSSKL